MIGFGRWTGRLAVAALLTASLGFNALALSLPALLAPLERAAEMASDLVSRDAAAVRKAVARERARGEAATRRAVAKTKATARLRRLAVAVPFVGLGAAAAFELADYEAWKKENPQGDFEAYAQEALALSREVIADEEFSGSLEGLDDPEAALHRVERALALLKTDAEAPATH